MNTQHTPGPWDLESEGWTGQYFSIWTNDDRALSGRRFLGSVDLCCDGCDNAEANARLIAAAPDLLKALEYMLEVCPAIDQQGEEAHRQAISAIAKATGAAA